MKTLRELGHKVEVYDIQPSGIWYQCSQCGTLIWINPESPGRYPSVYDVPMARGECC